MIGSIRDYILTAEGAADESIEAEEMEDKLENEVLDIVIVLNLLACLASGANGTVVVLTACDSKHTKIN